MAMVYQIYLSVYVIIFSFFRYAEEVVGCFRLMVLFVIAACTFVITISAIAMVTVSKTFER